MCGKDVGLAQFLVSRLRDVLYFILYVGSTDWIALNRGRRVLVIITLRLLASNAY